MYAGRHTGPARYPVTARAVIVRAGERVTATPPTPASTGRHPRSGRPVCGIADDGAQALDRLAVTAADVVLMDVRCRGGTAPRPLAASSPAARPRRFWCSAMR
ncbi:hypothetical protein Asera_01060 [Actinocatenispora sera]|uniref:Uncharacterized protein n=1 Tax=Actinocatenispora sera TaxID=390989 RepID=A0A810KV62_9ACTN|nr:hypothetical protein Asera_01060 [Actinocatenispora sera]